MGLWKTNIGYQIKSFLVPADWLYIISLQRWPRSEFLLLLASPFVEVSVVAESLLAQNGV